MPNESISRIGSTRVISSTETPRRPMDRRKRPIVRARPWMNAIGLRMASPGIVEPSLQRRIDVLPLGQHLGADRSNRRDGRNNNQANDQSVFQHLAALLIPPGAQEHVSN